MRDSRLIVIAAEGSKTEKKYFEDLAFEFHNARVKVFVLKTEEDRSSPEHVIKLLDDFKADYIPEDDDLVWLVIDVDRWEKKKLAEVASLAKQKQYNLAVSNPCFELWMLLHHRSLDQYPQSTLQEFRENRKDGTNRTRLERELISILGQYNKSKPATKDFIPFVQNAVERARALDIQRRARWPNDLGSRVYRLVSEIMKK